MCGPFCSVPPIGMMTVVVPVRIRSCNSVHVSSSTNTVAAASAGTPVIAASRKRTPSHGAARIMCRHYAAMTRIRERPVAVTPGGSSRAVRVRSFRSFIGWRFPRRRRFSISTATAKAIAK